MQAGASSDIDFNSAEAWKKAKEQAKKLGYVPSSFSIAVRTLVNDQYKCDATLRPVTKYQVSRLLKTPSFISMFYHATCALRGSFIDGKDFLTVGGMMELYDPLDLAAIIGSFIYYRKCRKLLGDRWPAFEGSMRERSMIAASVGNSMPQLGIGACMITENFAPFGRAALFVDEAEKQQRHENRVAKGESPSAVEMELWGCTGLQTSVFILSTLGFGVDIGNAFTCAHDPERKAQHLDKSSINYVFKLGHVWTDTVLGGHDQPIETVPGEYYPMSGARKILDEDVQAIKGGAPHWLSKKKDDVSEEKTPQLFKKPEVSEEIPEELLEVFSMEEITKMEEEDFDDLIDQLDAENEAAESGELKITDNDLGEIEDMLS